MALIKRSDAVAAEDLIFNAWIGATRSHSYARTVNFYQRVARYFNGRVTSPVPQVV